MKTILTALVVTVGLLAVVAPASAGYKAPHAYWISNAFANGD